MIWFTSDLHFGHENIIKICSRPYADINDMDEALIENWNSSLGNVKIHHPQLCGICESLNVRKSFVEFDSSCIKELIKETPCE